MKKSYLIFILWFVAISVPISYLMGFHTLAFRGQPLNRLLTLTQLKSNSGWQMIHLLSSRCGCSKRASKYLAERGLVPGIHETVLILDGDLKREPDLRAQGFELVKMNGDEAYEKYGLESVPQLLVIDSEGGIRYSGGYDDERGERYQDVSILSSLKENKAVTALPIFGCANGTKISKLIDPWGFKYGVGK